MKRSGAGFTLIEVVVALAIVALALPALLVALYQQVDGTAYLRDKSLARLVAANRLEEFRIISSARQTRFSGEDSGQVEMAGQQWRWELRTLATDMENFQRIEIAVKQEEAPGEQALYTLVAFMNSAPGSEQGAEPL